jgi:hypothetical protein
MVRDTLPRHASKVFSYRLVFVDEGWGWGWRLNRGERECVCMCCQSSVCWFCVLGPDGVSVGFACLVLMKCLLVLRAWS